MTLFFFLKGLILGFSIAAPVGPIGILCIRRTLAYGMSFGFISGIGTATADAIYGAIAAFGLTAATRFLLDYQFYLKIVGGFYLLYLGVKIFMSQPSVSPTQVSGTSLTSAYISAFLLTLTNPMTIIMFIAIFTGFGIGGINGNYLLSSSMVLGVFLGSLLWWLLLSGITTIIRSTFDYRKLRFANIGSGLIIAGFGVVTLLN
ncbi:amino acid transporter [Sporomusaceae bacterium FL31]|nr:amino acid transporter [Sporomusaceae bacterium FL31]GCE34723.1 amino acid transporter [Sporomusaceae bacterium]